MAQRRWSQISAAFRRASLFLFFLIPAACPGFLHAQHVADALDDAFRNQDFAQARRLLGKVMEASPQRLQPHLDDIEYMLLELGAKDGAEIARRPQTDTLLKLYAAAMGTPNEHLASNLARRAMLATRFPEFYTNEALPWLREAMETAPYECPLHIYPLFFDEAIRSVKSIGLAKDQLVRDWLQSQQLLYLRGIHNPEESEDCDRLSRAIDRQMRSNLPGCTEIQAWIPGAPGPNWNSDKVLAFLAAAQLGACPDTLAWNKAVEWVRRNPDAAPSTARVIAAEAMDRGHYDRAMDWWEIARNRESQPSLVAADLLFQAEIRKLQQDFRGARSLYERAMQVEPGWGEPFIRLVDLYRDGDMHCKISAFDHKALNWLLIDLCYRAVNCDPSYAQEATRRIYLYEQAMPTADEIRLRGLKSGDSWPLRCWMSTSTTVK